MASSLAGMFNRVQSMLQNDPGSGMFGTIQNTLERQIPTGPRGIPEASPKFLAGPNNPNVMVNSGAGAPGPMQRIMSMFGGGNEPPSLANNPQPLVNPKPLGGIPGQSNPFNFINLIKLMQGKKYTDDQISQ